MPRLVPKQGSHSRRIPRRGKWATIPLILCGLYGGLSVEVRYVWLSDSFVPVIPCRAKPHGDQATGNWGTLLKDFNVKNGGSAAGKIRSAIQSGN